MQLRQMEDLPDEIKAILFYPHELEVQEKKESEVENTGGKNDSENASTIPPNTLDDAIVELNESTQSVFWK